jgi:replication factor C subunit 3/5
MALLRELFGASVEKVKVTHKTFDVGSKSVEISTISSNHHIEMNPSDAGINDIHVVQAVIKELAATHGLKTVGSRNFKVVVLNEVDRLSVNAQHALRRTMEKYMATCRLILCSESMCRVTGPLRSRCLSVRIPAPTHDKIVDVLQSVAKKEKITLPGPLAANIAQRTNRNLRKALLALEALKVQAGPTGELSADTPVRLPDWEMFVDTLCRVVCEEQSPQQVRSATLCSAIVAM